MSQYSESPRTTNQRKLKIMLMLLYRLDVSDERHVSSLAWKVIDRTEKEIKWHENEAARKRILDKYGLITSSER